MLESVAQVVFFFALIVVFLSGLSAGRLKLLMTGLVFLSVSFVIAVIWASDCQLPDYVLLKCNPKAAIFAGMGIGMLSAALVPKKSRPGL